jgi:transcriptional regulator with XRE-family HTH domain
MAKAVKPVDRLVGQNIRIFRTAKGMSQTELGAAVGVTFQQVQKYEKGANRVGASRLVQIAQVLGVPASRLLDDAAGGGKTGGPALTDLLTVPYAVQMLQAFAAVSSDDIRRSLLNLTQTICARREE